MPTMTGDLVLSFGKYKGYCIRDVPTEYLDWLLGQEWAYESTKDAIEAHLKTRSDWND